MGMMLFSDIVEGLVKRAGWSYREIERRSGGKVGKDTVYNWASGRSRRPQDWRDLVHFGRTLSLTTFELNQLLQAAQHPPLIELKATHRSDTDQRLLKFWQADHSKVNQLPALEARRFVGRQSELTQLNTLLNEPGSRCAIVGLGGLGKSTLAIQAALQTQLRFPDGILWARLTGRDSVMSILQSFAQAFGDDVSTLGTLGTRGSHVRSLLANKRVLIILDDVTSGDELNDLLPGIGQSCVIMTTRNRSLAQSRNFQVISPAPLETTACRALIASYIGADRVAAEPKPVAELGFLVDGLPLALQIVASTLAQAVGMPIAEYVKALSAETDRLSLLTDWGDTSKDVLATFEISYQQLSAAAQVCFIALAAFDSGSFSIDAVSHITTLKRFQAQLHLAQLSAFSLIDTVHRPDESTERYQLHALLRSFARHKAGKQITRLRNLATDFFLDYLEAHQTQHHILDLEWPHIAGTTVRLVKSQQTDRLRVTLSTLSQFSFGTVGYLDQRGHWRWALNQFEQLDVDSAEIALKCCVFCYRLSLYDDALRYLNQYQQAMGRPITAMDIWLQAHGSEFVARLRAREASGIEEALSALDDTIASLATLGDAAVQQQGYLNIVKGELLARKLNARREAMRLIENGLAHLPDHAKAARASAYAKLAALSGEFGDLERSGHFIEQGIVLAEESGNKRRLATLHMNQGIVAQRQGDLRRAEQSHETALSIFEVLGDVDQIGSVYINLGMVYVAAEQPKRALAVLVNAESLGKQYDIPALEAFALATMIRPKFQTAPPGIALATATQAYQLCVEQQLPWLMPYIEIWLGKLTAQHGDPQLGLTHLKSAIAALTQTASTPDLGLAQSIHAQIYDQLGQPERAALLHQEALSLLQQQDLYEYLLAQRALLTHLKQHSTPDQPAITTIEASIVITLDQFILPQADRS